MKTQISIFIILATFLLGSNCLFGQKADRSESPRTESFKPLAAPAIQQFQLVNGLKVYLVEKNSLPLIQFDLVFNAGSIFDPENLPGLASMTGNMMDEGAGDRDALALSDEIDFLGIRLNSYASLEQLEVNLFTPTSKLEQSVALFADMVMRPRFDQIELDRKRTEALVRLAQAHDEARIIASTAFSQAVFGKSHPYGKMTGGTESSLKSLTTADLRGFHKEFITPANGYLVIVGDLTKPKAEMLLNQVLAGWSGGMPKSLTISEPPKAKGLRVIIIDKPGAAQTELRFGHPGVSRSTKDYYPLEVMNTILGASFTSRLNQNLREQHGYTYGARSQFSMPRGTGSFMAAAAVQTEVTDKAISEFMKELRNISVISEAEAEKARQYEALSFPAEFENIGSIASNVSEVVFHKLPTGYLNKHMQHLLETTRSQMEMAAKTYIDTKNMVLIAVGDRAKIEKAIKDLKLGKVEFLTKEDILGLVPKVENKP